MEKRERKMFRRLKSLAIKSQASSQRIEETVELNLLQLSPQVDLLSMASTLLGSASQCLTLTRSNMERKVWQVELEKELQMDLQLQWQSRLSLLLTIRKSRLGATMVGTFRRHSSRLAGALTRLLYTQRTTIMILELIRHGVER
jgi:hypothetical protein